MKATIAITESGGVSFIHDDALMRELKGQTNRAPEIKRASHVEPTPSGEWCADMAPSGGRVLGPFAERRQALKAETKWIESRMRKGGI